MPISSFRYLSIFIYLCASICAAFETLLGYLIAILLIIVATFMAFQYKCPRCHSKFDLRMSSREIFCPKCGESIEW